MGAVSPHTVAWRYDPAVARRGVRRGRERGCWVYIPRDELEAAGIPIDAPPPWYKTTGAHSRKSSHRVFVNLYPDSP